MIAVLLIVFAAEGAEPSKARAPAVGVVRSSVDASVPALSVIEANARVRVGPNGRAELHVLERGLVRLSAGAEAYVGEDGALTLVRGRVWLLAGETWSFRAGARRFVARGGTSLVVSEAQVAVAHGRVDILDGPAVPEGYVWSGRSVSRGGDGVLASVRREHLDPGRVRLDALGALPEPGPDRAPLRPQEFIGEVELFESRDAPTLLLERALVPAATLP